MAGREEKPALFTNIHRAHSKDPTDKLLQFIKEDFSKRAGYELNYTPQEKLVPSTNKLQGQKGKRWSEPGGVEGLGRLEMCDLLGLPPTAIPRAQSLPRRAASEQHVSETCGDASR